MQYGSISSPATLRTAISREPFEIWTQLIVNPACPSWKFDRVAVEFTLEAVTLVTTRVKLPSVTGACNALKNVLILSPSQSKAPSVEQASVIPPLRQTDTFPEGINNTENKTYIIHSETYFSTHLPAELTLKNRQKTPASKINAAIVATFYNKGVAWWRRGVVNVNYRRMCNCACANIWLGHF